MSGDDMCMLGPWSMLSGIELYIWVYIEKQRKRTLADLVGYMRWESGIVFLMFSVGQAGIWTRSFSYGRYQLANQQARALQVRRAKRNEID
jgi:hypothetical protein